MGCAQCGAENDGGLSRCAGCGAELPAPTATVGGARRHLTVMFCDLVGSTMLSEQLDPEDVGELVLGYQELGRDVVARFGGSVAQYLGDGLLTYFGFPVAHEHDAERAVLAALAILESLPGLTASSTRSGAVSLAARIGIHTGPVVVGEMGSADRSDTSMFGSTPNVAARLEALAAPGTVVVSDATRRLLRDRFDLDDLGTPPLKGIDRPIRVWSVRGVKDVPALRRRAGSNGGLSRSAPRACDDARLHRQLASRRRADRGGDRRAGGRQVAPRAGALRRTRRLVTVARVPVLGARGDEPAAAGRRRAATPPRDRRARDRLRATREARARARPARTARREGLPYVADLPASTSDDAKRSFSRAPSCDADTSSTPLRNGRSPSPTTRRP